MIEVGVLQKTKTIIYLVWSEPPSTSILAFLAFSRDFSRFFLLFGVFANLASSVPVISTPKSLNSFFNLETLRLLLTASVVLGITGLFFVLSVKKSNTFLKNSDHIPEYIYETFLFYLNKRSLPIL